ncbi:Liprin-Beta-1 [Manis pentadactyla]|nr:Liprin-Beta-1 [Manis pentadactyla]
MCPDCTCSGDRRIAADLLSGRHAFSGRTEHLEESQEDDARELGLPASMHQATGFLTTPNQNAFPAHAM